MKVPAAESQLLPPAMKFFALRFRFLPSLKSLSSLPESVDCVEARSSIMAYSTTAKHAKAYEQGFLTENVWVTVKKISVICL